MDDDAARWLPLAPLSRSSRIRDGMVVTLPAVGCSFYGFGFGLSAGRLLDAPGFVRLALALLFAVLPLLVAAGIWMLLNPVAFVDFSRDRFRIRGRTIDLAEIDVARYLGHIGGSADAVVREMDAADRIRGIRIGAQNGPQVSIFIHAEEDGVVTSEYRDRLAEVIRRSTIDYPRSTYDPTGRFATYNFPENLDKAAALAFVLGADEPSPAEDESGG